MAASQTLKRILAGVVLAVVLRAEPWRGRLKKPGTAYERGDFATALRLWRQLAAQGNAFAQDQSRLPSTLAVRACLRT